MEDLMNVHCVAAMLVEGRGSEEFNGIQYKQSTFYQHKPLFVRISLFSSHSFSVSRVLRAAQEREWRVLK